MCGGVTSAIGPAAGAVRRQCQYVLTRVRHHSLHRSNDGSRFGRLQRARIERHRRACCASVLRLRRRIVGFLFSISCGPCLLQGAPMRACGGFLCCLLRVQLLDLLGDAWRLQAAALVRRKAVRRGRQSSRSRNTRKPACRQGRGRCAEHTTTASASGSAPRRRGRDMPGAASFQVGPCQASFHRTAPSAQCSVFSSTAARLMR